MEVISPGIVDGKILTRYGKNGTELDDAGCCLLSIPMTFRSPPAGTKSFAVVMQDYDCIPFGGISWIHWVVGDILSDSLPEDASRMGGAFVEGATSWTSGHLVPAEDPVASAHYRGMGPPDFPHTYTFDVYALDCVLGLKKGFWLNDLLKAMKGHILAHAVLEGEYDN